MKDIQKNVEEIYNLMVARFGKEHILGTFTVSLANYGFWEEGDKITTVTIYLPSFNDLCFSIPILESDTNNVILDARELYNALDICKWGAIELLYSNYYVLNPDYEKLFIECFLNNRNTIAKYNKYNHGLICKERAEYSFECGNIFEAERLLIAYNIYLHSEDMEDVFHIKPKYILQHLWDLKHNKTDSFNYKDFQLDFDKLLEQAKELENNRDEVDNIIKNGIVSIMSAALQTQVPQDVLKLTETEKTALRHIIRKIDNGIGNISISNLVIETGISRPVYKNVLNKLEKMNIATIENQGVKGTFVDIKLNKIGYKEGERFYLY